MQLLHHVIFCALNVKLNFKQNQTLILRSGLITFLCLSNENLAAHKLLTFRLQKAYSVMKFYVQLSLSNNTNKKKKKKEKKDITQMLNTY